MIVHRLLLHFKYLKIVFLHCEIEGAECLAISLDIRKNLLHAISVETF